MRRGQLQAMALLAMSGWGGLLPETDDERSRLTALRRYPVPPPPQTSPEFRRRAAAAIEAERDARRARNKKRRKRRKAVRRSRKGRGW